MTGITGLLMVFSGFIQRFAGFITAVHQLVLW